MFAKLPLHTMRTSLRIPASRQSTLLQKAYFSQAATLNARKNSQDKDSIDVRSYEYSRSGTDDDAVQAKGAFDPNTTKPDEEMGQSEKGKDGSNNEVRL